MGQEEWILKPMVEMIMIMDILFNKPQMVDILSLELIIHGKMKILIFLLIKTETEGQEEWTQTYGGGIVKLDILFNQT